MSERVRTSAYSRNETAMRAGMIALITIVLVGCTSSQSHEDTQRKGADVHTIHGQTNILDGTWNYMPGATVKDDGLYISADDFKIVEQDGSGGQSNPPINLYGTHLEVDGDFAVDATVNDRVGPADIQLYGAVPIIQDEFRIEPKSVRLTLDNSNLKVSMWDGASQQPVEQQTFTIEPSDAPNIGLEKHDQTLDFTVNNKKVGSLTDPGIFTDHKVWFGADSQGRGSHWFLSKIGARGMDGASIKTIDTSTLHFKNHEEEDTLQHLATRKRPGFLIGAAMALGPLTSDEAYTNVALRNFGLMTTENALKWQFVHPQKDIYNFAEADALVAIAQKHNIAVHGHTLVFGEANPSWISDMPTATAEQKDAVHDAMIGHIRTIVGHFKGQIASWDVVNEPFTDEGNMRDHIWFRAMGEQYVDEAFKAAHESDPKAKLFLNMYGIETPGKLQDATIELIKRLQARGAPIDGVGIQGHVYEHGDAVTREQVERSIKRFASLGIEVRISENDVYSDDGQKVQAEQYANYLQACIDQPACQSYTTWGVSDRYDQWRDDNGSVQQGQDFLWDKDMKPTPAVTAIQSVLQR